MPDTRTHRGPHPEDRRLFSREALPRLRAAVADLSWLLSRGYAEFSALKLVGDRYQLTARQRVAVRRSACPDESLQYRRQTEVPPAAVRGEDLVLDGLNVLTTVEAALGGGVILRGRDGCDRDLASVHGTYRRVAETEPAVLAVGRTLAHLAPRRCRWLLDSPVSNTGRLKTLLREVAARHGWPWDVELVPDPDRLLIRAAPAVVATADSVVLDRASRWLNLARVVLAAEVPGAWRVDLSP